MEFVGPGIGPLSLSGNILNKNYFVSLLILSVVVVSETCLAAVIPSSSVNQITVRVLVDKIKDNYELSGFDLVAQDVTRSHKQLVGADGQTKLNFRCRMNGHV